MPSVGNRLTLLLLLICSALGAGLWQQTRETGAVSTPKAAEGTSAQSATSTRNDFRAPPLVNFREISQRPLFLSERKPPPPPTVERRAPPPPVMPLRLMLEGVVLSSREKVAVLLNITNSEVIHLSLGMEHDGWKLVSIEKSLVRFERSGQTQELTLPE